MAILNVTLTNNTSGSSLSNNNLSFTGGSSGSILYYAVSSDLKSNGKWYWEVKIDNLNTIAEVGIISTDTSVDSGMGLCYRTDASGSFIKNFTATKSAYGSKFVAGDVIGVALDVDNKKIEFFKNGVSQGSPLIVFAKNAPFLAYIGVYSTSTKVTVNFGEQPFVHTPPSSYIPYIYEIMNSILLKSNNKIHSLKSNELTELLSSSTDDFIEHGSTDISNFNSIYSNKNYILSPNEGNAGGLFEQQISRKPLTISSTNKLAIKHDGTYYTSTDGSTLTPLTDESEVETLGFNSLTLSQTIYDLVGVNPKVVAFSNTEDDITIETTTEPFTLYDEFGDEVEVLFYTDDDTVSEADLILEANWSPLDELEGNFEVVTWTDETDSTRTLEMSAIPKPQLIRKTTVSDIGGTLNGIIASTSSSNVRFLLTNNNSTWYKWNGTDFENVTFAKVDDILTLGNTQDELVNADYSKWTHSKINIGAFLKDDDTTVSKINELGIVTNSPIRTSQVSDLNFYILNTTAKIELDLKGLWLSGQLSDLDLTRVQYRVFLNEQPYYPQSGQFTNLDNPPLNIDITFKSEEIKINDWNTLRVEFKDSFGTVDYWQTTFVGNYSSLMFMDTYGNYYSDDVGKVLQYLDFGVFFGGQYTLEHEVIVKNQYGYSVENLTIEANTGHLPDGVEVQFSDTNNPFTPQAKLLLPNELKNEEQVSFYIRMISDIDSVPNGENKFNIFVKAERKV